MSNQQQNQVATQGKPKFSVAIRSDAYKNLINNTLQDPPRAQRFIAAISSAVAVNPALQECDAGTILSGALLGESLQLSPSPQLGQYYLIPFKDRSADITKATFVLGYKGYVQLALRSGMYKRLNVLAIKEGEFRRWNPLTEELDIDVDWTDPTRQEKKTVGYFAFFEYVNGFQKAMYWTYAQMLAHAERYSKAYQYDKRSGKKNSFWSQGPEMFDDMAYKTMLRQIISKWGVMSIELQTAFERDNTVSDIGGTPQFVEEPELTNPLARIEAPEDTLPVRPDQSDETAPKTDAVAFSDGIPMPEDAPPQHGKSGQIGLSDL